LNGTRCCIGGCCEGKQDPGTRVTSCGVDFGILRSLHLVSTKQYPILIAAVELANAVAFGAQLGRIAGSIALFDLEMPFQNQVDVLENVGSACRDLLRSEAVELGDLGLRSLGVEKIDEQIEHRHAGANQLSVFVY
jgi:hypothetical protein